MLSFCPLPTRQVSGHDFSRAVKTVQNNPPYAVGSRAAAPSKCGFGLLGRKAAERETKT
jgi:hypothetical protein